MVDPIAPVEASVSQAVVEVKTEVAAEAAVVEAAAVSKWDELKADVREAFTPFVAFVVGALIGHFAQYV